MRKIYLSAFTLIVASGVAFSQSKTEGINSNNIKTRTATRIDVDELNAERGGSPALWSDDFSEPGNWTMDYDPTTCDLMWEVGVGLSAGGPAAIATIESTTAANGFAMIDSDEYGGETGGTCVEDSWLQTANPIDLSGYSNVVLEFETWYRRWNYEACYVVVSTDGVTWPELTPDTDISGLDNVWNVFPDLADATSLASNPTLIRLNISEAAGNQSQVWIRFHWTGTWGYTWFVDDVKILEQPANDLVVNYSFISHTGDGNEFGRIPQSQLGTDFNVGGEFYNFGYVDQTNVQADFDLVNSSATSVLSSSTSFATATVGSTYNVDEYPSTSSVLPIGLYEGSFTVTSDAEGSGAGTFGNNTYLRNLEVTEGVYSIDGLGNHPAGYQNIGSLGTNSFEDAADGFMMLAYYPVQQTVAVLGVEILLSTATVPGGTIIVSLHDTADVFADDVTLVLEQTDVIDITQADVDAGGLQVLFEQPYEAQPGGYFASVEMFSNGNASDIRILDDLTVPQPSFASMIYIPNDQVYTNGNAVAIRLLTSDNVGIGETSELSGVSVYPNPTEGQVRLNIATVGTYSIDVINVLGEQIYNSTVSMSTTIDLSQFGKGMYVVRVSNGDASHIERVVVK
jgi:hypothetical protein